VTPPQRHLTAMCDRRRGGQIRLIRNQGRPGRHVGRPKEKTMDDAVLMTIGVVAGTGILTLLAASLTWVYRDAASHGKTALVWLLIAFFTWPFGVLVYAMTRGRTVRL
jgi:hypothetical protein